jgi:magnesium transporter
MKSDNMHDESRHGRGAANGEVRITVIDYDEKVYHEFLAKSVGECHGLKDSPTMTWINVDGIHDPEVINDMGKCFDFHPLLIEDIVDVKQRPKIEYFDNYILVVLKMLTYDEGRRSVKTEHVAIVLGENFVLSFQEDIGDVFDPIRQRIREGKGKVRKSGPDYLLYKLIDAIVDNYFIILEKLGEEIDVIQEAVVLNPTSKTLHEIHRLKRETIYLRKSVWPLREVVASLEKGETRLIKKSSAIYFRDVYDHTIQVMDTVETFRDITASMLDIYLSSISNRLNEVMKVLTIISTVFMPLTFMVGIYGMNFNTQASPYNMPELNWYWGYPAFIVAMAAVVVIMLLYFRRRRWL